MPSEQNPSEIWATRIQRELLALTTDNADAESVSEVRSMIPRFVRVQQHSLELEQGLCSIDFIIDLDGKQIVVTIDPSLKRPASLTASAINPSVSYPFVAPLVRLKSGAQHFPEGSTAQDGDLLGIDLSWTPSLHLTDAIMNVSLKIKESILQGEPLHKAPPEQDPVDDIQKGVSRFANSLSKGASSLTKGFLQKGKTPVS